MTHFGHNPLLYPTLIALLSLGCGDSSGVAPSPEPIADAGPVAADAFVPEPDTQPPGLASLGQYSHATESLELIAVGGKNDGLNGPRDLAFHPDRHGELWVVNKNDESMTIIGNALGSPNESENIKRLTPSGHHFLAIPSGVAFGAIGYKGERNLATIHEQDQYTQGPNGTPKDFMGPTMYTSHLGIFDGGHGGHLDMLHNTPLGMGIAWEKDNVFWVFDGAHSSLSRYDFATDHGPGGADHSDGSVRRYAEGEVRRVEGIPSHLAFDATSNLLYVADTGNNRIAVLRTDTGTDGASIFPNYDGVSQVKVTGAEIRTLIDGSAFGLVKPSGLALSDGVLYVTDNETSQIQAFDLVGMQLDWLQLDKPAGSLMGIEVGPDGALYIADFVASEIIRIQPKPADDMAGQS